MVNLIKQKKLRERDDAREMQRFDGGCLMGMEMKGRRRGERIWVLERDSRSLNEFGVTEGWVGLVAVSRNLHEVPRQGGLGVRCGTWGKRRESRELHIKWYEMEVSGTCITSRWEHIPGRDETSRRQKKRREVQE